MINVQIRQFREDIILKTNASPLPVEVKRLVFAEIMKQLEETADSVICEELTQSVQERKKEELTQLAQESKKEEDSDEQSVQSD